MEKPKFDFDPITQKIIDKRFSKLKKAKWKKWFEISTKEEYINIILKNLDLYLDIK